MALSASSNKVKASPINLSLLVSAPTKDMADALNEAIKGSNSFVVVGVFNISVKISKLF